jgi:hypothetical protein
MKTSRPILLGSSGNVKVPRSLGRRAKWKETTEWWTDNERACRRAALSADDEHRSTAMSWTTRLWNTCRREETAFDDDDDDKTATAANKEIMHDACLREWVTIDDDDNDDDDDDEDNEVNSAFVWKWRHDATIQTWKKNQAVGF